MGEIPTLMDVTASDDAFILELYVSVRADEVAGFGWPREETERFLRMQCQLQLQAYRMQFPGARHQLVLYRNARAGRMITTRGEGAWSLIDLSLLPEYRNLGWGGRLIRELQVEAAAAGCGIRLHVLEGNRARNLYERLGFRFAGGAYPYSAMEWTPSADRALSSEWSAVGNAVAG